MNRKRRFSVGSSKHLIVAAAAIVATTAVAAFAPTTTLVSVNAAGTDGGDVDSSPPVISGNGRYVAFTSFASNLTANDSNGFVSDVFVRDLKNGTTTLVSVNAAGTGSGDLDSSAPSISADGRFVAFVSGASDLVTTPVTSFSDIFVRDLKNGTTTLVTVNGTGTAGGDSVSFSPSISADGRYVAFLSYADDLVAGDGNFALDVFVRDLKDGTTQLVSVNAAGTGSGDADSFTTFTPPPISADGRYIAFESGASDLVAGDGNGTEDVFVRDMKTGTTTLVSVDAAGTGSGGDPSYGPSISGDGRVVAFQSYAENLTTNDGNGHVDVFVRDLKRGTTTLASVNATGTSGGNADSVSFSGVPSISGDGKFVAFESAASDLVANDGNGARDVFVRDLKNATTTLVSVGATGTGSGAGASFVFASALSDNGRFVTFTSRAADLTANDGNTVEDVFVRDLKNGTTTLLSVNGAGTAGGDHSSIFPAIDGDGRVVAYWSLATNLGPADGNGAWDVYARLFR